MGIPIVSVARFPLPTLMATQVKGTVSGIDVLTKAVTDWQKPGWASVSLVRRLGILVV